MTEISKLLNTEQLPTWFRVKNYHYTLFKDYNIFEFRMYKLIDMEPLASFLKVNLMKVGEGGIFAVKLANITDDYPEIVKYFVLISVYYIYFTDHLKN